VIPLKKFWLKTLQIMGAATLTWLLEEIAPRKR